MNLRLDYRLIKGKRQKRSFFPFQRIIEGFSTCFPFFARSAQIQILRNHEDFSEFDSFEIVSKYC